jgi:ribokinase
VNGFDVVVVGSANLDLVATAPRLPHPGETVLGHGYFEAPGGKGLNQAVAAARAGARVAFVGALGGDAAGELLRQLLVDEGIDVTAVAVVDAPTGRALIGVGDDGENSIIVVPGANGRVNADHVGRHGGVLGTAKVVLCQLEVPLEAAERAFQLAGPETVRVLNPAPAPESTTDEVVGLVRLADVVVPNEHELALLGGVEHLTGVGVAHVVVTEGARGARHVHGDHQRRIAPLVVTPVDTTGAGDSFCGVLAARLALGDPLPRSLEAAVVAGALATTGSGAVPSLPRWSEVERHLSVGS